MKDHTVIHVVPDKVQGEISALYSVPGTHVLFTGPGECARHNCRMHYQLGRISWLCPTDTEIALGKLEGMVLESVGSLVEHYNGKLFGVILYSGCQTEFLNVDFEYLLKTIRNRFHIAAAHHSISRFQRFDRLRLAEKDLFRDLFRLLEKKDRWRTTEKNRNDGISGFFGQNIENGCSSENTAGIQILSRPIAMAPDHDFHRLARSCGLNWVRNTGEWKTPEEFLQCREAVLNVVTAEERLPAARYLESEFGIPWIHLKNSYRLNVVENSYRMLLGKLNEISGLRNISAEIGELRQMCLRKVKNTLFRTGGHVLELDLTKTSLPWDVTRALMEYGFRIGRIQMRKFPAPAGMKQLPGISLPQEDPADREWVLRREPDLIVEEKQTDFRERQQMGERIVNLPGYLDRRTLTAGGSPCDMEASLPDVLGGTAAESARWGYSSICSLMRQIDRELDHRYR